MLKQHGKIKNICGVRMKTIIIIVLCICCIIMLCSCIQNTVITNQEPLQSKTTTVPEPSVALADKTIQVTPTPIKTTNPITVDDPGDTMSTVSTEDKTLGTLHVNAGDTLEKDIIPRLCSIFALSEKDVKEALKSCPNSKLINDDLKDFRRMEGILFPGKFEIKNNDIEAEIKHWVKLAEERYDRLLTTCSDTNDLDPQERLSLAAVIEWECLPNDYYSEVAAVFLNRLSDGSKLRSCATTEYALGYERPYLTLNDIKIDSVYNTYQVKGVPLGPICVVEDDCFLAAMQKTTNSKIYYFFNDYTLKEMFFFSDYDEFKKAGAESRELFDQTFDIDPFAKLSKKEVFEYPQ